MSYVSLCRSFFFLLISFAAVTIIDISFSGPAYVMTVSICRVENVSGRGVADDWRNFLFHAFQMIKAAVIFCDVKNCLYLFLIN